MKNKSLRFKLLAGLGILVFLQASSSVMSLVTFHSTRTSVEKTMGSYVSEGTSIADAQTHLLAVLRLERTFQEEQNPELLEERSAILGQLKGDLEHVIELKNSASHVEMAQALLEKKATHEQTFQALVQALATRGATEKEGLRGTLRAAVHDVEHMIEPLGRDDLQVKMLMCRRHEKDYMMRGKAKYLDRVDARISEFEQLLNVGQLDSDIAKELMASMSIYRSSLRELAAGDTRIDTELASIGESGSFIETQLEALAAEVENSIEHSKAALLGGLQTSQSGILLLLGVSLAIGLLISVRMQRAILNPIKLLHRSLEDLVSGSRDLTRRGDSTLGEFLDVNDAIASRLEELIVEINQRSNAMEQSSHELEASSKRVSESTISQAGSITSVNSTLDGITSTVEQATSHIHEANAVAAEGRTFAESGNSQIQEMQAAMEGISQASEQVTTVIKVIEDIAFQTNLLALNAAVEAARAGEAGKGFSVVAEEVRNLALRSAESVQETAKMIAGVQAGVKQGRSIVDKVTESFGGILEGTQAVDDLLDEIVMSITAQANAVESISVDVGALGRETHMNASQAEELTTTARSGASVVSELRKLTSEYTVRQ